MRPIILCGGSGTRLWPYSTKNKPKQFCSMIGDQTLLQQTYDRLTPLGEPIIVTHQRMIEQVHGQISNANIITEPYARDTAPIIITSALLSDPEEILVICPSDHHITEDNILLDAIRKAEKIAENDWIVTLGIQPTHPETGYGYIINTGVSVEDGYQVERFVEKPKLEVAEVLLSSGLAYWNAGIFVSKAKTIISEARLWCPDILNKCQESIVLDMVNGEVKIGDDFKHVPSKSIDYAILEKSSRVAVVPVLFSGLGWTDLGSWKSIHDLSEKDDLDNVDIVAIESTKCLGKSISGKPIIVIGLNNIGIIETDKAILVLDLDKSQLVKQVTNKISPDLH
jgi:mannose-1-phosphate guanylyltransferase/mannose-6-phosphate isomerase